MPVATVDGLRISYDDAGEGEPALLMMSGWCASRHAFDELRGLTSRHRRTLALDWRGHGESDTPTGDFGMTQLTEDALAVIEASGLQRVIPVATAHASWIAVDLRRRLGPRIEKLVLIDWLLLDPPRPFVDGLAALQTPAWRDAVQGLFSMWTEGVDNDAVRSFVHDDMGSYGAEMWGRAGREIEAAYRRAGAPFSELLQLERPAPTLHIYAQPPDPAFLEAQQALSREHPWFSVHKLDARSHFPTIEVPDQVAELIERFVTS